jgi:hypothetical protein
MLCAAVTAAMAVLAVPAEAAENPFTPAEACSNDFGGSWAHVTDGHRVINHNRTVLGEVYLMYDHSTGKNCVATIKRVEVGSETPVAATLRIKGRDDALTDKGRYKYYAAIEGNARDTCVAYRGTMSVAGGESYSGGREDWGNCA